MWRTVQFLGLAFLVSGCLDQMPNDIFKRPVLQNTQVVTGGVGAGSVGAGGAEPRRVYVRRVTPEEAVVPVQPVPPQPTVTPVDPIRVIPVAPQVATPPAPQPDLVQTPNSPSISDEQDFNAVSSRQSIESDASRLEANRQQYKVIAPTDLPTRSGNVPNVVAYALQTNNPVGVPLYRRLGLVSEQRHLINCAQYGSSEQAQQDFLAQGGPVRDFKGLDPDGDGYACKWDPRPFRSIKN